MKGNVVLRLEVEHMKHSMLAAIQNHHLDIEQQIKSACDAYCASGELEKLIAKEFQAAATESISDFFRYGEGKKQIDEVVVAGFKKHKALKCGGKNEPKKN